MRAKVRYVDASKYRRIICISDIHGYFDLFVKLLEKVCFSDDDLLLLLGDLYTKGPRGQDTLKYISALSEGPNVFALRGNCDWGTEDYLTEAETAWLNGLPHVIETESFTFVHGGLVLEDAEKCMKNDAFMEQGLVFEKYVVTGHWPTVNYCHGIASVCPIVDEEARIISIDGGCAIKDASQMNAFIIRDGAFSFESVDANEVFVISKPQKASGGHLNITWNDRFVELLREGGEFSLYRHLATGREIELPTACVWTDGAGNLCECDVGTDYFLPVEAGEEVSLIKSFSGRIFAKKRGVLGWVML